MNGEQKERLRDIGGTLGVEAEDIGRMRRRSRSLRYIKLIVAGLSPMVGIVLGFLYGQSTQTQPLAYPYMASVLLAASPIDPRLRAAMDSHEGLKRKAKLGGGILLIGVIVLTATGFIVGWIIGGAHQVYGPSPKYGVYSRGDSSAGLDTS
jgi:hypothetical protein